MFELVVFIALALLTWRIIRSSYNQLAHYLNAGQDNEAITHESQLKRLLVAAGRYYDERKWVAAEKAYLKVLKLDHKNIQAYRRLGMVYSHLHSYEDAAECFEFVVKANGSASDWQNFATVLYHIKYYDQAIAAMEKANDLDTSITRLLALAKLYEVTNQTEQVGLVIQKAQALNPDSPAVAKYRAHFSGLQH